MAVAPGSVWLGAQGTQSRTSTGRGIGRYMVQHAFAVLKQAPDVVGSVRLSGMLPFPEPFDSLRDSGIVDLQSNGEGSSAPAIYHVMSPFEGLHALSVVPGLTFDDLWPPFAREPGVRTVVTLYDLIPLVMRETYLDPNPFEIATYTARLGLIRAAHQVLTISERTAGDAIEHLGVPEERVTVIDSGVSEDLAAMAGSREEAEAILSKGIPKLRRRFILYVGGDDHRKNLEGMIRAYSLLPESVRDEFQLVIVCEMLWPRRVDLREFARRLGVRGRDVVLTGFVSDQRLAALYRACELFVFPSLYEGAGLPILEAMSCGAPVAASSTSSIPEILGDLEATFDPADPADIASCIARVLGSPGELESLRERSRRRVGRFTWERVAERTLEGYERALESSGGCRSEGALPLSRS